MKKIHKIHLTLIGVGMFLLLFPGCEPKKDEAAANDVVLPKIVITDFPATADVGSIITITGSNLSGLIESPVKNKPDTTYEFRIGDYQLHNSDIKTDIISWTNNSIQIRVPRLANAGKLQLINIYQQITESESVFTPIYPNTTVSSIPDTIFLAQDCIIEGTNMDLIASVALGTVNINITRSAQTETTLTLENLADLNIRNPTNISFISMAGNEIPIKTGIVVLPDYPWAELSTVAPNTASTGDVVYFSFATTTYLSAIKHITFALSAGGSVEADFEIIVGTGTNSFIAVTIPAGELSGSFTISTYYQTKTYTGKITLS